VAWPRAAVLAIIQQWSELSKSGSKSGSGSKSKSKSIPIPIPIWKFGGPSVVWPKGN